MPLVTAAILQVILLPRRCQVAPAVLDLPLAHDARPLGTEACSGKYSSLGALADVLLSFLGLDAYAPVPFFELGGLFYAIRPSLPSLSPSK
jgi:hypothetical protein